MSNAKDLCIALLPFIDIFSNYAVFCWLYREQIRCISHDEILVSIRAQKHKVLCLFYTQKKVTGFNFRPELHNPKWLSCLESKERMKRRCFIMTHYPFFCQSVYSQFKSMEAIYFSARFSWSLAFELRSESSDRRSAFFKVWKKNKAVGGTEGFITSCFLLQFSLQAKAVNLRQVYFCRYLVVSL